MASAAAADAWTTVSGMSFGSTKGPQAKTPGREVVTGRNSSVPTKPCRFNSTPKESASALPDAGASMPADNTTMSNSLDLSLSVSS
jgi:hypothetical protein